MLRLISVLAVAAIALVGLFPGLITPTTYAPVSYCSPTASFQSTFAMSDSEIAYVAPGATEDDLRRIGRLEIELDRLRVGLAIPGFSAAVVKDQEILWARGFGCADIASGTPATPDTPYHLASLTKPIAATVLLQLIEEGHVRLNDPLTAYGFEIPNDKGAILVEHLLSHTSQGEPGRRYHYCGDCFGRIDTVMKAATGKAFRQLVIERVIEPLELGSTMPGPTGALVGVYDAGQSTRFQDVWDRLATPYVLVRGYGNVVDRYATYFGSAAGLISSVLDYARFDAAIDRNELISVESQKLAWTPYKSTSGRDLPYGYGWFIQQRGGLNYDWHYGYWNSTSTLYVKVPERGLTFLIFANSDRLSSPYWLGIDANVRRSPAARAFLDIFVDD